MKGQSYRLYTPTFGILPVDGDGHRISITIPRDAIVTAIGDAFDGSYLALVEVTWEGKTILMFTQDLRTRGVLIKTAEADPASPSTSLRGPAMKT